jgi:iron-sulfur cluster assembly protein
MLSFTTTAIDQLKKAIEPNESVRVAVVGGGCAGMSYTLNIVPPEDVDDADMSLELDHIKVYVDPHSASLLESTTIDYIITLQKQGFVFNNPKSNTTCGCGMSFS